MNVLEDIIQQCHKRNAETEVLRQRQTVVTFALYKSLPYHIKVHCARRNPITLDQLENADISFMPIGHAPENDEGPRDLGGDRFLERQTTNSWRMRQWYSSWGIQIYTGIPSEHNGARWHDFEFTYDAICHAPQAVASCIETLLNIPANPLLTLTKSGGLRFSCRIQDYLHPHKDEAKFYIYKTTPTQDNLKHRDVYLQILGDRGYSRWDMRYEILLGNLLEPPIISKEILFAPIDKLRQDLHQPVLTEHTSTKTEPDSHPIVFPSLSSANLNMAKDAFLKRGFSYDHEANGFYYWRHDDLYLSMWEDQGKIWIRSTKPNDEFPKTAIPITDIWDDTGISNSSPLDEKIYALREGKLSPLAVKRNPTKLVKKETTPKKYPTLQERTKRLKQVVQRNPRILALVASEANILSNSDIETFLLKNNSTCWNIPSRKLADAAEERYKSKNIRSLERWRAKYYSWDQIKNIPIDIRIQNPFQHGNVCEDADRFRELMDKGGNPNQSLCPVCPVYIPCQERGHLSQVIRIKEAKNQISPIAKLFVDPLFTEIVEQTLDPIKEPERICIIDEDKTSVNDLFVECRLSKMVVKQWMENWKRSALGNFATALMQALNTQGQPYSNPIGQIRALVEAFKQQQDEIIHQMCYINIWGKVVTRNFVDTKTGLELAKYAIVFDNESYAYIPLDYDAEEKLSSMSLPTISPPTFSPDEYICLPMKLSEAISIGIFDVQTVEQIHLLPTVCRNPDWTYWHQLKCFFDHYPRDNDAPMHWSNRRLKFWIPPQLHPSVQRLLITSTSLTETQFRRMFPNQDIEVISLDPTAWLPDNRVYQLRTESKSTSDFLNYNSHLNTIELSKVGERYLIGIRKEIDRDPNIKHGIVALDKMTHIITDLKAKENVCFVESFKSVHNGIKVIEAVQVLWILGMPVWQQRYIWEKAQMLYGTDEKPLNYDEEMWTYRYKDKRMQEIYHQNVKGLLTQVVGSIELNRNSGKTVMILNNYELPDVTDRPETLLFDWEDYEIADGLDKLEETIRIRERFEAERDNLTAESSREEVERILGCSSRQANRFLFKLRGGTIPRISFREQILFLLSSGREKTTASLISAIDSSPQAIGNELRRLLDAGEIVRVRRGVYALPEDSPNKDEA